MQVQILPVLYIMERFNVIYKRLFDIDSNVYDSGFQECFTLLRIYEAKYMGNEGEFPYIINGDHKEACQFSGKELYYYFKRI